jgi:hypothetical protein
MDLSSLMNSSPRPAGLDSDASIVKALHGLATAITDVHNFNSKKLDVEFKGVTMTSSLRISLSVEANFFRLTLAYRGSKL